MIQMNNRHYILVFLAACMLLMTSCLSDDETTVTYYDDAAITSFSLGTLSRTLHTTNAAGKDSTYTTTVDCSTYTFVINQQLGIIYNLDSCQRAHRLPRASSMSRRRTADTSI